MGEAKATWGGRRKGAGRPSLFEGAKKVINLTLNAEALELLKKTSDQTGYSRSDVVNKLIFDYLK